MNPRAGYIINAAGKNVATPALINVPDAQRGNVPFIVVQLPADHFYGSAEGLRDWKKDQPVAVQAAELMLLLTHVISNPALMLHSEPTPEAATEEQFKTAASMKAAKNSANSRYRILPGEVKSADKVESYFELVLDAAGKVPKAYRYWFFFPEPSLCINHGLETLFSASGVGKGPIPKPGGNNGGGGGGSKRNQARVYMPWEVTAATVGSREAFIDEYLVALVDAAILNDLNAKSLPLTDENNPANLYTALSLDAALSRVPESQDELRKINARYRSGLINLSQYEQAINEVKAARPHLRAKEVSTNLQFCRAAYISPDEESKGITFPRPHCVYRISAGEMTPMHLYVCNFPSVPPPPVANEDRLTPDELLISRKIQQKAAQKSFEDIHRAGGVTEAMNDAFAQLARKNKAVFEQFNKEKGAVSVDDVSYNNYLIRAYHLLTPAERAANPDVREINERMWEDFGHVFSTEADSNDRMRAIAGWGEKKREDCHRRNATFSMIKFEQAMDPTLSPFANMKIIRMRFYEDVYLIRALHGALDLIFTAAMSPLYHKYGMKVNVFLTGGAESGKSHIGALMKNALTIPGTVEGVSHSTTQADNTATNCDTTVEWRDEIPAHVLGIGTNGKSLGGTGDAALKSLLTSGIVEIRSFFHTDNGERITVKTTSQRRAAVFGATNEYKFAIPDALLTRVVCLDCAKVNRFRRSIPEIEMNARIFNRTGHAADDARLVEENEFHRKLHYLTALTEKAIECLLLHDVNMTVADAVFTRLNAWFEERGYDVGGQRNVQRLLAIARTNTIFNAIYIVFCTTTVYASADVPFTFRDILHLEPYLVCTEEIAVYCYTQLISQVVEPLESEVVKVVARERCKYTRTREDPTALNAVSFKMVNGTPDYNYLCVDIEARFQDYDTILERTASAVAVAMSDEQITTHTRGVVDILHNLAKRRLMCSSYVSENVLGEQRANRPVLVVNAPMGHVYLLRQFVDECFRVDSRKLPLLATRALEHAHTRPKKILTACSFLDTPMGPHKVLAPHILQTVNLIPNAGRIHSFYPTNLWKEYQVPEDALLRRRGSSSSSSSSPTPSERAEEGEEEEEAMMRKKKEAEDEANDEDVPAIVADTLVYALDRDMEEIELLRHLNACGYPASAAPRLAMAHPVTYCARYNDVNPWNRGIYPHHALAAYVRQENRCIEMSEDPNALKTYTAVRAMTETLQNARLTNGYHELPHDTEREARYADILHRCMTNKLKYGKDPDSVDASDHLWEQFSKNVDPTTQLRVAEAVLGPSSSSSAPPRSSSSSSSSSTTAPIRQKRTRRGGDDEGEESGERP